MARRIKKIDRQVLQELYGEQAEGWTPTHEVVTDDSEPEYVRLSEAADESGLRFAYLPGDEEEPEYSVLPGGKWQSLIRHGQVKARPVQIRTTPSGVYFLQNKEGEVKVGWTTNLKSRRRAAATWNAGELTLIGWLETRDPKMEHRLHELWSDHHIRGEWYALPQNVAECPFLRTLLQAHGLSISWMK